MARIRTIKPEFFTSEDIVSMSPLARLLYIALWCESDKEGRMAWKPKTFKMRYLPADTCNIDKLCQELLGAGLIVLYGDGLAFIPKFAKHQHVNPRESASTLPIPEQNDACARVSTREHLDLHSEHLDMHAQVGREGKGREGDTRDESPGFVNFWETWPKSERKQARGKCFDVWKKAGAERCAAEIAAHVSNLKQSAGWMKNNGEFIGAPLVYLNERRWEGAEAAEPHKEVFV